MNIFIAMALSAHIFPGRNDAPSKLTEDNVGAFVRELAAISNGQRPHLDSYAIADYLMTHIADQGQFKTTIRYDIEDATDATRDLTINKTNYISDLIQGLKTADSGSGNPTIEYVTVSADGRTATAMVNTPEHGTLPITDASGEKNMVPVVGTSYCEQHIVLSPARVLQLTQVNCTTDLALASNP